METKDDEWVGRCNKRHLLKEEYVDTNGYTWKNDCPICIEEMNKIRREIR